MNRLLLILILTFNFQSLTKADDIRDFEIEGISLGDSLLDYYSKKEIMSNISTGYNDNEFSMAYFKLPLEEEQWIQFHFKTDSNKLTIYGIDKLFYPKTVNKCIKKRNEIVESISALFNDLENINRDNWDMASGHGKLHGVLFKFDSGNFVEITCYEYNKDYDEVDHGRVAVVTVELEEWIKNKAYK
jgi:hypothetical protein|tara:strand:+ start:42 stop:602 length:561 start_codon:yes stop_codon:yes gene_type:complete